MECKIEGCTNRVHCIGLCQNHYRQERRRQRGLSKSGPKRQPDKPYSKYKDRSLCSAGHELSENNTRVDARGHRFCITCFNENRPTHCPQGHEYSRENTYVDKNNYMHCRTCARATMAERRPAFIGQGGKNAEKTHCPHGHEYSPENTIWSSKGSRICRKCARRNAQAQSIKKYGITPEQLNQILREQDYSCAICHAEFTEELPRQIDHDHSCCDGSFSCGTCVRGLLCHPCNVGIDKFKDDTKLLQSAIEYLEKPPIWFGEK
jgi:hypothetical protein